MGVVYDKEISFLAVNPFQDGPPMGAGAYVGRVIGAQDVVVTDVRIDAPWAPQTRWTRVRIEESLMWLTPTRVGWEPFNLELPYRLRFTLYHKSCGILIPGVGLSLQPMTPCEVRINQVLQIDLPEWFYAN